MIDECLTEAQEFYRQGQNRCMHTKYKGWLGAVDLEGWMLWPSDPDKRRRWRKWHEGEFIKAQCHGDVTIAQSATRRLLHGPDVHDLRLEIGAIWKSREAAGAQLLVILSLAHHKEIASLARARALLVNKTTRAQSVHGSGSERSLARAWQVGHYVCHLWAAQQFRLGLVDAGKSDLAAAIDYQTAAGLPRFVAIAMRILYDGQHLIPHHSKVPLLRSEDQFWSPANTDRIPTLTLFNYPQLSSPTRNQRRYMVTKWGD